MHSNLRLRTLARSALGTYMCVYRSPRVRSESPTRSTRLEGSSPQRAARPQGACLIDNRELSGSDRHQVQSLIECERERTAGRLRQFLESDA